MKRIPLFLVCCLFTTTLLSQRYNLIKKNSIDLILGVDNGFWLISSGDVSPRNDIGATNRAKQERHKPAFRLGFNYNYALSQRSFIKTGLRFTNPGYRTQSIATIGVEDLGVWGEPIYLADEEFQFSYIFIEVPLHLRYVYSKSWCKSYVEGGISGNYYLQTRINPPDSKNDIPEEWLQFNENINRFSWMANLSIGAEFCVVDCIPFFIQMTGRYQLNTIENNDFKERFVGLGIETGVRFLF